MANIIIKLRHPNEDNSQSNENNFWEPFYIAADKVRGEYTERINYKILESRVKTNFPYELKQILNTLTPPLLTIGFESKINLSASIAIAVQYIKEGSLEIGLLIEPIDKLGKLFDNNFEYFEIFLKSYIPKAFYNSLQPDSRANVIGWKEIVNQLEIELDPSSNFRNDFSQITKLQTMPEQVKVNTNKANWLWIISNTSLVLPVLLTAVLLYFAFTRLENKETAIEKKMERVIEQQNRLIERLLKIPSH